MQAAVMMTAASTMVHCMSGLTFPVVSRRVVSIREVYVEKVVCHYRLTGEVTQIPQIHDVGDLQAGCRSREYTKPKHAAEAYFLAEADEGHASKCESRIDGQVKIKNRRIH